ncbi:MAG TPA: hydrolase [Fimbriimonadaceae bacterium]|nr:hydrolase [Fimbriimonadaceae bacterium]
MANPTKLVPTRTALVVIDLQRMIMSRDTKPYSSSEVLVQTVKLADVLRQAGGLVVCVHVSFSPDLRDRLTQTSDNQFAMGTPPDGYDLIAPELQPDAPGTITVRKRQWGAFYGTDLDMQLRRRGIESIIMSGISTNIGVESTARSAYEHGYQLYFAEDAMACMSEEEHRHSIEHIFKRIGHVRSVEELLAEIKA